MGFLNLTVNKDLPRYAIYTEDEPPKKKEEAKPVPKPAAKPLDLSPVYNFFTDILPNTLKLEGGRTVDTGGLTYKGMTQSNYDIFRKARNLPTLPVDKSQGSEISNLYYDEFFKRPGMAGLPKSTAGLLFDYGVNAGPTKAIKDLQNIVGAKPDGKLGPKTKAAIKKFINENGEDALGHALLQYRAAHYEGLISDRPDKYKKYEKGWKNRIDQIRNIYLDLNPLSVKEAGAEELIPQPKKKYGFSQFAKNMMEQVPSPYGVGKFKTYADVGFVPKGKLLTDVVTEGQPEGMGERMPFYEPRIWRNLKNVVSVATVAMLGKELLKQFQGQQAIRDYEAFEKKFDKSIGKAMDKIKGTLSQKQSQALEDLKTYLWNRELAKKGAIDVSYEVYAGLPMPKFKNTTEAEVFGVKNIGNKKVLDELNNIISNMQKEVDVLKLQGASQILMNKLTEMQLYKEAKSTIEGQPPASTEAKELLQAPTVKGGEITVYHGTNTKFEGTPSLNKDGNIYFTEDRKYAGSFADKDPNYSKIYEGTLNVKSPANLVSLGVKEMTPKKLSEALNDMGIKISENALSKDGEEGDIEQPLWFYIRITPELTKAIKNAGYDSATFLEKKEPTEKPNKSWIVFDKESFIPKLSPKEGGGMKPLGAEEVPGNKEELWDKKGFAINPEHIKTTEEGKTKILDVSKQLKDDLQNIKGEKPLTHEEVIQAAKEAEILKATTSRNKTLNLEAAILKTKQQLAALAKEETVTPEFIETLKILSSESTNAGRLLESFKIDAYPEYAQAKVNIIKRLLKLGTKGSDIIEMSKGVDFNDQDQVTKFYRNFVKPRMGEIIQEYRYINLLSSPLTHIVNSFTNALQVIGVSPLVKLTSGIIDPIASSLFGIERTHYLKEVPLYYRGVFSSMEEASTKALEVLKGERKILRPDLTHMPTGSKLLAPFQFVPRVLEAADVFFRTMAEVGEVEALSSKVADMDDVKLSKIKDMARKKAEYYIFRQALDPENKEGQGKVLSEIDRFTSGVYKLRGNAIVNWYIPFVQTPMAIVKQGLEFSPIGIATLPGAKDKVEQLSKALIGSIIFAGAGILALQDRTTWSAPTGKKEKEEFYASGRKPYSIKIGDTWVSYSRLGPVSYPIAMATAVHYYLKENPKALTDTTLQRSTKAFAAIAKFFSDQSYMEGLGSLVKAAQGDVSAISRSITNIPSQLIPLSSLLRWTNNMIDPVYRNADKELSLDSLIQNIEKGLPILSKNVPAYKTSSGKDSTKSYPIINAFSPAQISKIDYSAEEKLQLTIIKKKIDYYNKFMKNKILETYKSGNIDEAKKLNTQYMQELKVLYEGLKYRMPKKKRGFSSLIP